MARVEIPEIVMKAASGVLLPLPGASVQVNVRDSTAATVYQAATGVSTFSNPLTTDANGRIDGWLEEGPYDLVVSGTGITTYTQRFEAVSGNSLHTGKFLQSKDNLDPFTEINNQATPLEGQVGTSGDYADSGASGGIFHLSSYVENTGTRATVAVFGGSTGPHSFGGNFVAYANGSGNAAGAEIDYGNLSVGGTAYGLVIKSAGGNPALGAHIQMQSNASSQPPDGIIFHVSGGNAPVTSTGSLIRHNGTATYDIGINFTGCTFTTAAIVLPPGGNIAPSSTTGTKIGTSTGQKIGFWNAAPVVRPVGWTAATGTPTRTTFVTSTVTLPVLAEHVKALIDDLILVGLIG